MIIAQIHDITRDPEHSEIHQVNIGSLPRPGEVLYIDELKDKPGEWVVLEIGHHVDAIPSNAHHVKIYCEPLAVRKERQEKEKMKAIREVIHHLRPIKDDKPSINELVNALLAALDHEGTWACRKYLPKDGGCILGQPTDPCNACILEASRQSLSRIFRPHLHLDEDKT